MIDAAARYRELVDGDSLAVYDSTPNGVLLSCNDAFARLLGYDHASDVVGADLSPFYWHADRRDVFLAMIRTAGRVQNVRGKVRRADGSAVDVMLTGIGEFGADGALTGIHGHLIDISETVDSQRRLVVRERQFAERLMQAEKLETVGRLAGGIAHDFNNLLTAILGYAELLISNDALADRERRDLEEIQKAGQRAASLTQQLLAFSRKQVLIPKDVDLNATVSNLRSMLTRVIREDIALTCALAPQPAIVRVDPAQIEQALLNLVLNARDALPTGGHISIDVDHLLRDGSELVRVRITDDGVGMTADARAHLFEPFFTTKDVGKGTGLGLASVHGIVTQSNGFIDVTSEPGHGTAFSLYFPAVRRADMPTATDARTPAVEDAEATILLVEDEDAVRSIITTALRRCGYRVLEAATPGRACEIFEELGDEIDLLVSDVVMPDMHGPALAQRLVGVRPNLRILFISGYADALGPLDGISSNVGFLAKPFQASALIDRVREMLATTSLRKESWAHYSGSPGNARRA
ncbi:MAG TPA: ATP-binding protein [Vicinamibacterales bacterium]|nr:ATP-binding protein [Vicinamibacterales bacterium]